MLPYFRDVFGNAASKSHPFGWRAEEAVEVARRKIAAAIGAQPREIVFTSGATESNNLAILGVADAYASKGRHLVTVATEHHAVLDPMKELARRGFDVSILPVDSHGLVDPSEVERALRSDTILVSIMTANNEIGTIQPISEIGQIAKRRGVVFHTDAAQAIGKIPFRVGDLAVDLVSISAHKLYGPKGSGALYVRSRAPRVRLHPILFGGGHERGLRSGTLNVPGVTGLGRAVEISEMEREEESSRLARLRDRLQRRIASALDGVVLNGDAERRLPGNLNLSFSGVDGDALLMALRDLSVSSGAACTSAHLEPSHVLIALGLSAELAHASIRFGLGRSTTEDEIDFAADTVIGAVTKLRQGSVK